MRTPDSSSAMRSGPASVAKLTLPSAWTTGDPVTVTAGMRPQFGASTSNVPMSGQLEHGQVPARGDGLQRRFVIAIGEREVVLEPLLHDRAPHLGGRPVEAHGAGATGERHRRAD